MKNQNNECMHVLCFPKSLNMLSQVFPKLCINLTFSPKFDFKCFLFGLQVRLVHKTFGTNVAVSLQTICP